MEETMTSKTDNTPDVFDDWFEAGTLSEEIVELYGDQAAVDELEAIRAEVADLDDAPKMETISEPSAMRDIEARWDAAYARWQASKSVWTLHPIDRKEVRKIWRELPNPPAPERLGPTATDADKDAWVESRRAWALEVDAQEDKRVSRFLVASVASMETPKGKRNGVTVAQIDKLRAAVYGVPRVNRLMEAYQTVMEEGSEPDRPFSQTPSGDDRS